jgi:lipopolysaccharide heptosyltransferase II
MREYGLLLASASVTALTNLFGLPWRSRPLRRILVVKLDHLGDVVAATPALRALRDAHLDAAIDLLVSPAVAPLFMGTPLASRVLTYDSPRFRREAVTSGAGTADPARAVARGGYDAIVELRGDWGTLALPVLALARRRVDRGTVRIQDWLSRRLASKLRPPLHEVETNLAVVRPLLPRPARAALEASPPAPEIHLDPAADHSMRARLASLGADFARPLVCLHPGAAWRPRAWRPERFAAIADWVAASYHAQVAVVGSSGEGDVEAAMKAAAVEPRILWLFGTLSLPELAALFRASRLVIGNDSGLAHLAAACGAPVVALFGPQDPGRFRPWSPRARVLHHPVECFPCDQIACVRPEHPCVNLIETAEVSSAVREVLGPPPAA